MTISAEPQMRGFTPVTERTWDSNTLGRRIMLSKIAGMSLPDAQNLLLETTEVISSVTDQIAIHQDSDIDWLRRANGKKRHAKLFATACRQRIETLSPNNKTNVDIEIQALKVEAERLKTQRTIQDRDRNRRRSAKMARTVHNLLLEEWGPERTDAFYKRAEVIADALIAQEEGEATAA